MRFLQLHRTFFPVCALLLCLVFITGCKLFIPEDQSGPRFNTVVGGRHVPQLNAASARGMAPDQSPEPQSSAAPVAPAAPMAGNAAAYPPVSPETRALAEQRMAASGDAQPKRSMWDRMAFWRSDDAASAPAAPATARRQMPTENTQVAGNYPSVNQVPPSPQMSGPGSTADQLSRVRSQLEQDRMNSTNAGARLNSDAAAEPSMLAPMPSGAAPGLDPVTVAPVAPPAGVRSMPPSPQSSNYMNLPPPPPPLSGSAPAYRPAPPVAAVAVSPAPASPNSFNPLATAYAPQTATRPGTMEPILLRPPGAASSSLPPAYSSQNISYGAAPARAPAPTQTASAMPPAANGGFDPMAGSPTSYYGAGQISAGANGYLPDSRYSNRRVTQ